MKHLIFSTSLIFAFLFSPFALSLPMEDCAEYMEYGLPSNDGKRLCRTGYLLARNPEFKTPIWMIERHTKERAFAKMPRWNKFRLDLGFEEGEMAELPDGKGSGCDRGYVAPSADFDWSGEVMDERVLLSNMIPQNGLSNKQIRDNLENHVRNWAAKRGEVIIYTGPVYGNDQAGKTIGKKAVDVPDKLYKVVYDPQRQEAIAFILPKEAIPTKDLPKYIVPISDIEYITGLDFLSILPRKE